MCYGYEVSICFLQSLFEGMYFSSFYNTMKNVVQMCMIHGKTALKVKSPETNPTHNPQSSPCKPIPNPQNKAQKKQKDHLIG